MPNQLSPENQKRVEKFKREFLATGSECTRDTYQFATDILDYITSLLFEVRGEKCAMCKDKGVIEVVEEAYGNGYKQGKFDAEMDRLSALDTKTE